MQRCFILLLLCWLLPFSAQSQEEDTGMEPVPVRESSAPVALRPVAQDQWQKATETLNYSDDIKPQKPQVKQSPPSGTPNWSWDGAFWWTVARVVAISVLVLLVVWLLIQAVESPANRVIKSRDGVVITPENVDAYLHESDLDFFLQKALSEREYAQAVRIQYLRLIKALSQSGQIRWSREKTNRDYQNEMSARASFPVFREVTRRYEAAWYGNTPVDEAHYRQFELDADSLHPKGATPAPK